MQEIATQQSLTDCQKSKPPSHFDFIRLAFVSILLASIIGLHPAALVGDSIDVTGADGDVLRQITFASLLVLVAYSSWIKSGPSSLFRLPLPLAAIIIWIWLSLAWATAPEIGFRRVFFSTIVILALLYAVRGIPYNKVIQTLTAVCCLVVILDWVSIAFLPLAVHQATEVDKSLIGAWRGLHLHKNEAGAFCAFSGILLIHEMFRTKSWLTGGALCLLAFLFLLFTSSKTSIGFVVFALAGGAASNYIFESKFFRRSLLFSISLSASIVYLSYSLQIDDYISDVFDDPASLTGRVQIWSVLAPYIRDHILFGSGYGSFWEIGGLSPIYLYAPGWVSSINHAHNGYINLVVQIGIIGCFIVIAGLVVYPLYLLFLKPLRSDVSRSLMCSMILFGLCDNLLESGLLDRANPTWVLMLIPYIIVFDARQGTIRPLSPS